MFAVVQSGGKQYRVAEGDVIRVERWDSAPGSTVCLDQVLMLGGSGATRVGAPLVDGADVLAQVVEQTRGPKLIVFKKKRRQNYRRKKGHRQDLTVLRIASIRPQGGPMPEPQAETMEPAAEIVAESPDGVETGMAADLEAEMTEPVTSVEASTAGTKKESEHNGA